MHPLNLFRDGILGKLSYDPVYSIKIPKVIGEYMGTGSSANNGLVGDMYANLPVVLGVFLMPLILVILFRLLDAAAETSPKDLYRAVCVFCYEFLQRFLEYRPAVRRIPDGLYLPVSISCTKRGARKE